MTFPRPKASTGGHPTKLPTTKLAVSDMDPGCVATAVNDWEPKSVIGLVDTAKTWHGVPKQYRRSTRNRK